MIWLNTIAEWLLLHHYGFSMNAYSLAFGGLILFTLMVVAKYSRNYLKGEVGEIRFWLLFSFFALGILLSCFAENLKTFYVGWEMVGLASFFLIGFYQTNSRSIENSLIALSNYKICDLFFVMAILLEESNFHTGSGLCLILATLAKSAQLPFSSWLYRALEGPTPSSTLFYGGLSLHLGAFVLLQFSSLWDHSGWLRLLLGSIGLASAIFGFLVGSVRSDLKTSFAFASISQVGLIYCEMAMGFYNLAMWHIVGHNLLRTWNYLRGMSFFDEFFREEYHQQENWLLQKILSFLPPSFFFHSMNSFYLDQLSIFLRKWGLFAFAVAGCIGLAASPENSHYAFLGLGLALFITVGLFFKENLKPVTFLTGLVVSQILFLVSIHSFFEDKLEHLYLLVCSCSLALLIFSLWPAVTLWMKQEKKGDEKQTFLGLATKLQLRHIVFLIAAILVTGSPGTFEFFVQEGIIDEIWSRSHLFLSVAMVCLTLNTVHTFKIGQWAFLGERQV
ncbi:MAG: proton-conducting transporter transmembrane domain-containing protein [Pseudobdellovibrionaceae bacterium]